MASSRSSVASWCGVVALQFGQQRGYPGGPVPAHPLGDTVRCTNQIRQAAEVDRHRLAGFVALPALP